MEKICLSSFPTPYFLVDEQRLRNNLAVLQSVCLRTGCKILLAQKAFGEKGSYLSSAMISFTQIGWFGVGIAMLSLIHISEPTRP